MIPMAAATLGWLPNSHPLYSFLSQQLLPVCLVLLLIGADLKAIARLGPWAIGLMGIGSVGTILGALISFWIFRPWLPDGSWGAVGALAGSWIGGSANLIAVKEALQVPDPLIAPVILVDAVVAYSWMGLLIWSSAWQTQWNRVIKSAPAPGDSRSAHPQAARARIPPSLTSWSGNGGRARPRTERGRHAGADERCAEGTPGAGVRLAATPSPLRGLSLVVGILLSLLLSWMAQRVAARLPSCGSAMSPATWTILLVTTAALLLSLTPLRKLEEAGLSRIGTIALYLLLASIGARSNLQAITQAPVFAALGATWILIHGLVLGVGGFLLRAPLGLIATASQANIGGPISAPIVGAAFCPRLAGVGLLMAVLGNLLGTYLGLFTAAAARLLVRSFPG